MAQFYYGLKLNLDEITALYRETGYSLKEPITDVTISPFEHFLKVYGGNLAGLDVAPVDENYIYVGVYTARETLSVVLDTWPDWMVKIRMELYELLEANPDKAILTKLSSDRFENLSVHCLPLSFKLARLDFTKTVTIVTVTT